MRSSMSAVLAEESEDSSSLLGGEGRAIVGIDSVLMFESLVKAKLRSALGWSEELRVERRAGDDSASRTLAVSLEAREVRMVMRGNSDEGDEGGICQGSGNRNWRCKFTCGVIQGWMDGWTWGKVPQPRRRSR